MNAYSNKLHTSGALRRRFSWIAVAMSVLGTLTASAQPMLFPSVDYVALNAHPTDLRHANWKTIGPNTTKTNLDGDLLFPRAVKVSADANWKQISEAVTLTSLSPHRISALIKPGTSGRARLLVRNQANGGPEWSINGPIGAIATTPGDEAVVSGLMVEELEGGYIRLGFDFSPLTVGEHHVRIGPDGAGTVEAFACGVSLVPNQPLVAQDDEAFVTPTDGELLSTAVFEPQTWRVLDGAGELAVSPLAAEGDFRPAQITLLAGNKNFIGVEQELMGLIAGESLELTAWLRQGTATKFSLYVQAAESGRIVWDWSDLAGSPFMDNDAGVWSDWSIVQRGGWTVVRVKMTPAAAGQHRFRINTAGTLGSLDVGGLRIVRGASAAEVAGSVLDNDDQVRVVAVNGQADLVGQTLRFGESAVAWVGSDGDYAFDAGVEFNGDDTPKVLDYTADNGLGAGVGTAQLVVSSTMAAPSKWLYVAAEGDVAAGVGLPVDGAQAIASSLALAKVNPFATIQAAISRAEPGTAIVVQGRSVVDPMVYAGQVKIGAGSSGSFGRPIRLLSEVHRGALIVGPEADGSKEASAVVFSDAHDFELHNFQIQNRSKPIADNAAVKIVNSSTATIAPNRITVAGCYLFGVGRDGIKMATSREVTLVGNYILGGAGWSESAIDGVGSLDHVLKWNTIRGRWKEGPAFKGGSMRVVFHHNDVEITTKPSSNSVALLVGELGLTRSDRPMPFGGETWRWAEAQDFDIRNNRLVTDYPNALWLRGSTDATIVGNFFACAAGNPYAAMKNARSGLWKDQPTTPPSEYAPFAEFEDAATLEDQRYNYHSRNHTFAGNWISQDVLPTYLAEPVENVGHAIEPPATAASASAVLTGVIGDAGWNAYAIYDFLHMDYTVVVPPSILAEPQNLTVTAGWGAAFSVTVQGTAPLSYQWFKDEIAIPDATSASFTIPQTVTADAGGYRVKVGNASGSVTSEPATLTVLKAQAAIALGNLSQRYDGTSKPVDVVTVPTGLTVVVLYDGETMPPILPGAYRVDVGIVDPNYEGTNSATLHIGTTVLVRRGPAFTGSVDGSVQVLLPENTRLNGNAWISGDLLVPGTPELLTNGTPHYVGVIDAGGDPEPSNHQVVLSGNPALRYLVRQVDALEMPVVEAPPTPTGTRSVVLSKAGQVAGDFTTVRNLTIAGNAGVVSVPPGTYGNVAVAGNATLVLGESGATDPSIYNLQILSFNAVPGPARFQILGPIVLTVAKGVVLNGVIGSPEHPEWLDLRVSSGNVTASGTSRIHGSITVPGNTVTLNGAASVTGSVVADCLVLNGTSVVSDPTP